MKDMNKTILKVEKTLNKYKSYFGMSDWKIDVKVDPKDTEDYAYSTNVNYLDKEVTVVLTELFFDIPPSVQFNTIIHELVHTRIYVAKLKTKDMIEKIEYLNEEEAVDDIVKGFIFINK